ncbi:MAG: hypothetical protein ACRCY3_00690 [Sphingorhabdus sp.]
MRYDHNQLLLIRAELSDLVEALQLTAYNANPLQYLLKLENIRATASHYGLSAVAEIIAAFEMALQRFGDSGSCTIADSFLGILSDALGVAHLHPAASEAMLASIAIRLGG